MTPMQTLARQATLETSPATGVKAPATSRAEARQAKYMALSSQARMKGLSWLQLARAGVRTRRYMDRVPATFESWAVDHRVPINMFDEVY